MSNIKNYIRKFFNNFGFDIVRTSNIPKFSLLGLTNLSIRSIIDVGANTGQFARMISRFFPEAGIHCFEPVPQAFIEIRSWAENQHGRVKVYNLALGDTIGNTKMYNHIDHTPSSSLLKSTEVCSAYYSFTQSQEAIDIELTTLDKAIPDSLAQEILIKLDVQGYEDRVIRGGIETFRQARVCILEVCLDILYENQATFKDILLLLDDLGYRYCGNLGQAHARDGHVISIDAVFIRR